jgi:hypothetical protein
MITYYHTRCYINKLGQICGNNCYRLGIALLDRCVDLKNHKTETTLFSLFAG